MASEIRKLLLRALPIDAATVSVRRWQRVDMDTLAGWPEYEFPHRGFEFSFRALSSGQRDAAFQEREADRSRITLVAESADRQLIAYVALLGIDWTRAEVRALSCRVHPQFCGQGTGTGVLRSVVEWAFEGGVCSIARTWRRRMDARSGATRKSGSPTLARSGVRSPSLSLRTRIRPLAGM
jgi:RimJ/RimL family protein N-acetyltransferase